MYSYRSYENSRQHFVIISHNFDRTYSVVVDMVLVVEEEVDDDVAVEVDVDDVLVIVVVVVVVVVVAVDVVDVVDVVEDVVVVEVVGGSG